MIKRSAFAVFLFILILLPTGYVSASELYDAIVSRDLQKINRILEKDPGAVSRPFPEAMTPLHHAVLHGKPEVISLLIARGADVNTYDESIGTPLHLVYIRGGVECAIILIEAGADVNAKDCYHKTILMRAIESGRNELVLFLLNSGASLSPIDSEGDTAFTIAVKKENYTAVAMLVDRGVKEDFILGGDADLLLYGSAAGNVELVKKQISLGVDVNTKSERGTSAVSLAALTGKRSIIELLLEKGADVNVTDSGRNTPLHFVFISRNVESMKWLIDHGADVNASNLKGETPLHIASERGLLPMMKILVQKGAKINVYDNNEVSPLYNAVRNRSLESIVFLVEKGADVNKTYDGKSLPLIATESGDYNSFKYLMSKWKFRNFYDSKTELLKAAVEADCPEIIEYFSRLDVDVNQKYSSGETLLHRALMERNAKGAERLILRGANLNIRDPEGRTPIFYLHFSDGKSSVGQLNRILKMMIEKNADLKVRDKNGLSIIEYAAVSHNARLLSAMEENEAFHEEIHHNLTRLFKLGFENDSISVCRYLARFDKVLKYRYKDGSTFLHKAVEMKKDEIVIALLEEGADVNAVNNEGDTILHLTVNEIDNNLIYDIIARKEININALNGKGHTPLYEAILCQNWSVVRLLSDSRKETRLPALKTALIERRMLAAYDIVSTSNSLHNIVMFSGIFIFTFLIILNHVLKKDMPEDWN